jgi:hypothetical protein
MAHDVHIVGSVPLADADAVFTTLSDALGARLKRVPDGETGERQSWIMWLGEPVFGAIPALELSDDVWRVHEQATGQRRYRLKPGRTAEDIRIERLPYAEFATRSYAAFRRLKEAGRVPPGLKFQVDIAPAQSAVRAHVVDSLFRPLEPLYNDAIGREIDRIAAAIPHRDLAIQFDLASAVFAVLQRGDFQDHGRTKDEAAESLAATAAALGSRVPADAELLYHFCYGDNNHRHSVEPTDMGDMVDMANRLRRKVGRRIDLIHMPVPRGRADDAYFAPLKSLDLASGTELALGLVHFTDGIEGTKQRVAAARRRVGEFAIATECGFGRRDPKTIPELLRIHAAAAALD